MADALNNGSVMNKAGLGAPQRPEDSNQTPQNNACPASSAPSAATKTKLTYLSQSSVHCNESLRVAARLTDDCGNALANRQLTFAFPAQKVAAMTDDNGIASTTIVTPLNIDSAPLTVSYAGDNGFAQAQDSTTIKINRANTTIRYTGKRLITTGARESVTAVLTETNDHRPVPNAVLNFEVGSVRASATTDANGVATAAVSLPAAETFERGPMKITFAGNSCYNAALTTAEVTAYLRTAFVVWGGNNGGLSLGQRVNFWGHSWAKQVSAGDYQAHNDFKGYADTINQFRLCQINARTNAATRLNDSCWSTKPGQSSPPETIPAHIGVIIANSIDKVGARDFGNIAALAVVKVDPQPRYGAVPGKPGFGTIIDVIEDGAKMFPPPPALEASQAQPASVLPGQNFAVTLNLSNTGQTVATNVSINEKFVNLLPPTATAETGTIPAASTRNSSFQATVPALPARGAQESTLDYQKRLGAADGAIYASVGTINFGDATGRAYPAISASSMSRLQLPRLTIGIIAPPCVGPGMMVPYVLKISNVGSAVASSGTARVLFPDGTSTEVAINNLEPGKSFSSTVNWKVPTIAPKGATESNSDYLARLASFDGKSLGVSVSVTWKDVLGNDYGAVEQQCESIERVPILSQAFQTPSSLLLGQSVPVSVTLQNTGSGNAFQSRVRVTNPNAPASDGTLFNLPAGSSSSVQATLAPPPAPAKQSDETDASYLARLQAADNQPLNFPLTLEWNDAAGNVYGPITSTLQTIQVLPIVVFGLSAQETAKSGDTVVYTVRGNNVGHAEASNIDITLTLPGGAVQKVQLANNVLSPGGSLSTNVNFTIPATQPDEPVSAVSNAYWKDTAGVTYGSLSANAVTNIINPNQPPAVNAGTDQTVNLSETASLSGSASDDRRPAGSTLTSNWSKVSGPGAVSFSNPDQAATTAKFSAEGIYVLRLTASDSALTVYDEATINVISPPNTASFIVSADFNQGEGINIGRDEYNHLHIVNEIKPFNFIWVAVSSKGTIVKIDTDTGKILGEFLSAPEGQPRNPSRTTVDLNGNVWAGNRDGNSVVRIGLVENGQCVDKNGNGVIDTSTQYGDIRPWRNTNGLDTGGGVKTAEDECIINYTRVTSWGTRHVSVNAANDVWVSGTGGQMFDLIDGQTGRIKRQEASVGYGGYGGLIDKKGVIWSARYLMRWDTALPLKGAMGGNWKGWHHDSYGLCIDSKGNVWNTSLGGDAILKFAPDGTHLGTYKHGYHFGQGCVVDKNDDVWVAHSLYGNTVGHIKNDGKFVGTIQVGSGPTGVAVDAKGKIWATNHNSGTVSRIDPRLGPIGSDGVTNVGQVDLTTVYLGGALYNYSDMTGSTLSGAPAGGTWMQVFDSETDGAEWGVIGWNGRVCGDGLLSVSASSSNDGVKFSAPVAAANGENLTVPKGRYLKVAVNFKRASSGESPFLYDLTVGTKGFTLPLNSNAPPNIDAGPDQTATMPNSANLIGSVCDAGRLLNSSLSMMWEKVSGPGAVTFANGGVPATSATFSQAGEYVLKLTARDANLSVSDEVTVMVFPFNDSPTVNAGADQSVILPAALNLNGKVSDDALPSGSSVSISWSKLSGPGEVKFTDASAMTTNAVFSETGTYVLRLVGDDSQFSSVDDVTIQVFPTNNAPTVDAGKDQTIRLPDEAKLEGAVGDDGLPVGNTLTVAWSQVRGPGTVNFGKGSAAATSATFTQPGTYVLRLTASDSQISSSDELTILVNPANQPPSVNAGVDQNITLPDAASINATVTDDNVPEGSTVKVVWSKVSGPGIVRFGSPSAAGTTASFSQAGTYVLRLTASDSALGWSDDVTITANPSASNLPPLVIAGEDQTVTLPDQALLNGAVGDDQKPSGGTLNSSWSQVSGPGSVTFADARSAVTTAAFSTPGEYVLRLSAGDTELTAADDVTIAVLPVNLPPQVGAGADQNISFPNAVNLNGAVTDDGMPSRGTLSILWSTVSGPGTVTFTNPAAAITSASFSTSGNYVLRLTAHDSQHSSSDEVAITVNRAPTVEAGQDQKINLPNNVSLQGTVTDDALPAGKTVQVAWSKISGPGSVTFSRPEATATTAAFSEPGTYILRLNANDTFLEGFDELTITVGLPLPAPPFVDIASPTDGKEINSRFEVIGSVSKGIWKLEYSLAPDVVSPDNSVWTTFASGKMPIINGRLGTFDTTLLLNGNYALRLTSTDEAEQTNSTIKHVIVAGQQKVGNFTLSFEDLSIPVAGLPVQLTRTYDSRDKRVGDFGVGWTLGIKNIRLEKSSELGRSWQASVTRGIIPQYCVQPARPNIITITFPDGRIYKFQATTARPCQAIAPIEFTRFGFTPMPGTRGSLVPEASLDVMVEGGYPGAVELLDTSDPQLRTYDPTLFRFTNEDGTVFIIDQKLGVRSIADSNGNKLTIDRNGVTHSSGKSVRFVRDAQERISQITDPSGNAMSYSYDANGDLVSFRDRENNETRFTYNDTHGLLDVFDARGVRAVRNEYDDDGRLISHTDPSGKKILYSHDLNLRQETVTDRLGNLTLIEYDEQGNLVRQTDALGNVTRRTYDSRNNELSTTDPLGRTVSYTYDSNNNITSRTDPLGNVFKYTYDARNQLLTTTDTGGRTTTNTYDGKGNLLSTKDSTGKTTSYTYAANGQMTSATDPAGNVSRFEYDGFGYRSKEIDPLGRTTTYAYNPNGNALSRSDLRVTPSGTETLVTAFEYDKLDQQVKITAPDGGTLQFSYNDVGKIDGFTDQAGSQSRFFYDEMGRVVKTIYSDGAVETATYDAEGRRLTTTDSSSGVSAVVYDALGRSVKSSYAKRPSATMTYDAAGQVIAVTDARGGITRYEYNAGGQRTKTINALGHVNTYTFDVRGNQTSMTDAKGRTTKFEYDQENQRTRTVYADGTERKTAYDVLGRATMATDQAGKVMLFDYNSVGQLLKVTDAAGKSTRYVYDDAGSLVSQTDANGHTTTFEYDIMGRRSKTLKPGGLSESYSYDITGDLIGRTDPNGKTTTYAYDKKHRLIRRTPDASLRQSPVTYSYTSLGQRATMTDESGTTRYTYDAFNQLISKATPQGTLSYTYDETGSLVSVRSSNANGISVDYSYDALSRLSTVTDKRLANGVTAYSYDEVGNLAEVNLPNGVKSSYIYNSQNRLVNLGISKGTTALASYAYTLGQAGNRLSVAELGGRTIRYAYDDNYRLTTETITGSSTPEQNGAINYTYDVVGNRLTRASTVGGVPSATSTYDANNRLSSDTYDANGNTIVSAGNTYTYDFENRLKTLNGGEVSLVYDGDGERVAKTSGGRTERFLVDDLSPTGYPQVVEEVVDGVVQRSYTYGHMLISQSQTLDGARRVSFYGLDGGGSVRLLTDDVGNVTDTYDYDAFGMLIASTGNTPNVYLYRGEQYDPQLGFYYLRARYMNPETGRFITADSFEGSSFDPTSLHKYLYADNDPVNRKDPTGYTTIMEKMVTFGLFTILVGVVSGLVGSITRGWVGFKEGFIKGVGITVLIASLLMAGELVIARYWGAQIAHNVITLTGRGIITIFYFLGFRDLVRARNNQERAAAIAGIISIFGLQKLGMFLFRSAPETAPETPPEEPAPAAPAEPAPVEPAPVQPPPKQLYHRLEAPTQRPHHAADQESSGELWGSYGNYNFEPTARAYRGPLPPGKRGLEFETDVDPDPGGNPKEGEMVTWRGNRPGVTLETDPAGTDWAKIKIRVTKNTQTPEQ
jgi:RHS repeat-associated protein/uncharacterized repeat protein (TIGR01451 family)